MNEFMSPSGALLHLVCPLPPDINERIPVSISEPFTVLNFHFHQYLYHVSQHHYKSAFTKTNVVQTNVLKLYLKLKQEILYLMLTITKLSKLCIRQRIF